MVNASDAVGRKAPVYSLVIPIFNEEEVLPLLILRIKELLAPSAMSQGEPIGGPAAPSLAVG